MTISEEKALRLMVESIAREVISEAKKETKKKSDEDKKDSKSDNKKGNATKRTTVIRWLQDPAVNCAEIMRQLWHPKKSEEDSARSYFYKCRDGAKNDTGVPYAFTSKEINKLYSIKSSSSSK